MIRDEFLQKKKENLSSREIKKIRRLGERAFYISTINRIKQNIKLFNFSTILGVVCCFAPFIIFLYSILSELQVNYDKYIPFAVFCLVYIWAIIWFALIVPALKKKCNKYQVKLQELSAKEVNKFKR